MPLYIFITGTEPLIHQLQEQRSLFWGGLAFSPSLNGLQIIYCTCKIFRQFPPYFPCMVIPSTFWHSRTFPKLPSHLPLPREIYRDVTDQLHFDLGSIANFYAPPNCDCKCEMCGQGADYSYHHYFCPVYQYQC